MYIHCSLNVNRFKDSSFSATHKTIIFLVISITYIHTENLAQTLPLQEVNWCEANAIE